MVPLGERARPVPLNERVSRQLSRMPVRNTGPEIKLRKAMHAAGLRFRLEVPLPGRPDVVLTRAKIAIFVDGCFWHSCPDHGVVPKNNREWWRSKLDRNVERDRARDATLRALGWEVVHVWEHEDAVVAAESIRVRRIERLRSESRRPVSVPCENLVEQRKSGDLDGDEAVHS